MSVNRTVASTRSASTSASRSGEELLDLVDDGVDVPDPEGRSQRRAAPRTCAPCDVLGEVAAVVDRQDRGCRGGASRASEPGSQGGSDGCPAGTSIRMTAAAVAGLAARRAYLAPCACALGSWTRLGLVAVTNRHVPQLSLGDVW